MARDVSVRRGADERLREGVGAGRGAGAGAGRDEREALEVLLERVGAGLGAGAAGREVLAGFEGRLETDGRDCRDDELLLGLDVRCGGADCRRLDVFDAWG